MARWQVGDIDWSGDSGADRNGERIPKGEKLGGGEMEASCI